jgi:hypothetical protein
MPGRWGMHDNNREAMLHKIELTLHRMHACMFNVLLVQGGIESACQCEPCSLTITCLPAWQENHGGQPHRPDQSWASRPWPLHAHDVDNANGVGGKGAGGRACMPEGSLLLSGPHPPNRAPVVLVAKTFCMQTALRRAPHLPRVLCARVSKTGACQSLLTTIQSAIQC